MLEMIEGVLRKGREVMRGQNMNARGKNRRNQGNRGGKGSVRNNEMEDRKGMKVVLG